MRRKHNLCLVNTFWHYYGREFLYEFVWIARASQAELLAKTLLLQAQQNSGVQNGRFIRRLHIQTPILERCNPTHLRTILDCAPDLTVYSDYRSVRRNLFEESCDPRTSPEQLFAALAHPNNSLKRLSWTNYDDVSFHLRMSPMLEATAANLEFLELTFCSTHLHSITNDVSLLQSSSSMTTLQLPSLRTLKVTLDNATFSVLADWNLPALQNLSVVSADFSYAGPGFSQFFIIHGPKLIQLELGHSSSTIEEHYLTAPPGNGNVNGGTGIGRIPLASWCPNLLEFICSADAEWNWENPDWIAPHVLLPTHPKVQMIGIRDIDKRIHDDLSFVPSSSSSLGHDLDLDVEDDELEGEDPFFSLLEQVSSLLLHRAFPSLLYVRDLSEASDHMRRAKSKQQRSVLRFWSKVLQRCRERGVWLEDSQGVNVTRRDLRRFAAKS